jgi:hypothetical protein
VKISVASSTCFFDLQLGSRMHAVDGALVTEENRHRLLAAWGRDPANSFGTY